MPPFSRISDILLWADGFGGIMDALLGLLIIAAMIFVLARPFRRHSDREADIYRRVSGLERDEENGKK
jgi:uncharacterized membrane protein